MEQNITQSRFEDEQEVNLIELASRLWKKRAMIIRWCIAGAVIGLVAGFSIPKTYTASATLAPETQQKTASSVSSIASMMGMNLNNSVDAISVEMFPDVVHSTPFIVELFDLPVEFKWRGELVNTTLLDYMLEYQKEPWWDHILGAPFKVIGWIGELGGSEEEDGVTGTLDPSNLPKKVREVVEFFEDNIMVYVDKKTYKTTMSLEMQDPYVVAEVMNAVVDNLKKYMSDYRTSKARQDVENLSVICAERKADYYKAQQEFARYADANKNVIRQSAQAESERLQQEMNLAYQVYSQVAAQLETARIQEQQAKPVFVIIHPVTVPIKKTAPGKAGLLIMFTLLAGCCACAWSIIEGMIERGRKK